MVANQKYFAFISYKREDEKWAIKLKRTLEYYRLPSSLNGKNLPKNMRYVFRDIEEMKSGDLSEQIKDALAKSQNLIVICSPRAHAEPYWINKEIHQFVEFGKTKKIHPFIVEGFPHTKNKDEECFPSALLELTGEQERIGGNINEGGYDFAAVKLIAGMLDIENRDLWDVYRKEKKKKRLTWVCIITLLFAVVIGVAAWIWNQNNLLKEKDWKIMESQSRFVSEKASELIENGDSYLASLLALNILPKDLDNQNRPYTPEAERLLRSAVNMECYTLCREDSRDIPFFDCSSDGQHVITSSHGDSAKIWNLKTGQCVQEMQNKPIYYASFSLNQKYILTIVGNGQSDSNSIEESKDLFVMDAYTGKCVKKLKGHSKSVSCAEFYDNKHIVSTAGDGTIRIWDVESEKCIKTINTGKFRIINYPNIGNLSKPDTPRTISISSDGKRLITNYGDNTFEIWDLQRGLCVDSINGHSEGINSIKYCPSEKLIASCGYDNIIKIWDANTYSCIRDLVGHTSVVYDIGWNKDNKTIVSASNDSTVRMWNVETGICEKKLKLDASIYRVSFVPNSNKIVMALGDGSIRIWNYKIKETIDIIDSLTRTNSTVYFERRPYSTWHLYSAAISPNGQCVIKDDKNDVRVWDIMSKKILFTLKNTYHVKTVSYSNDGSRIITTTYNNGADQCNIKLWDSKNSSLIHTINIEINKGFSDRLGDAILYDDKVIAIADSTIGIWDIQTGTMIKSIPCQKILNYWQMCTVTYSPNNNCVAVITDYGESVSVIDVGTGTRKFLLTGHNKDINLVTFNPDENNIITASSDGTIIIWDSKSGKMISKLGENYDGVNSISFGKNGQDIIASYDDGYIRIWDLKEKGCICEIEEKGKRMIRAKVYNQSVVALSDDGKIFKWPFQPLQTLIDETSERFKNRQLSLEEREKYYLE